MEPQWDSSTKSNLTHVPFKPFLERKDKQWEAEHLDARGQFLVLDPVTYSKPQVWSVHAALVHWALWL